MNPWWLRPTAEGASEKSEDETGGSGKSGGEAPAARRGRGGGEAKGAPSRRSRAAGGERTGGAPGGDEAPAGDARAKSGERASGGGRSRRAASATDRPSPPPSSSQADAARPRSRSAPAAKREERRPSRREPAPPPPPPEPDLPSDDILTSADLAELRRELAPTPERTRSVADERKIAMFCDLENIAIGVRDSEIKKLDINLILERLLEKGKIIVKKAYCDWERYSEYKRPFHEAAIELIDIPQKYYSGKNSADIKMVVDAMDLCYSKEHLDTFAILSGDSDFSPLVSKLKENDKTVIGVGVKDATSALLVDNCDEFLYYEDIWRDRQRAPKVEAPDKKKSEAFRLMIDAMQALSRENKDVLWGSMIKQTMQRKKPSFNEGYYGYSTFSDLLEDAERNNLIKLKKDQRSGTYIVTGFSGRGGR